MQPSLSLITAVLPEKAKFFSQLDTSIGNLKKNFDIEWVVVIDGPDKVPVLNADTVVQLSFHNGIAQARNIGLLKSTGSYIYPIDGDDDLSISGLRQLLQITKENNDNIEWFATARSIINQENNSHSCIEERVWEIGELSSNWQSPFVFHPNSVMYKRELLLELSGWPAVSPNEDLGLVLLANEYAKGISKNFIVTNYRVWDGSVTAENIYEKNKILAFSFIEAYINELRKSHGRIAISMPETLVRLYH